MPQIPMPELLAQRVDRVKRHVFERGIRGVEVVERGPLERLGSDWGGWMIPADLVDDSWICYCAGAGGDTTFDMALINKYGATVRCIDPFEQCGELANEAAHGDPRFSFHEMAITASDGPVTLFGRDPDGGVASAANIYRTTRTFAKPGLRLESLMQMIGDARIDLLKLDIEGTEYEVLESTDLNALGVQVFCLELHHTSSATRARRVLRGLSDHYDVVHASERSDFTLLRR